MVSVPSNGSKWLKDYPSLTTDELQVKVNEIDAQRTLLREEQRLLVREIQRRAQEEQRAAWLASLTDDQRAFLLEQAALRPATTEPAATE